MHPASISLCTAWQPSLLHAHLYPSEGLVMTPYFVCLLTIPLNLAGQQQTPTNSDLMPSVSLALPQNVDSETVQIHNFLIGPFGGYGSEISPQPDLQAYKIQAVAEDKAFMLLVASFKHSTCDSRVMSS
jgi:hypothetical protein